MKRLIVISILCFAGAFALGNMTVAEEADAGLSLCWFECGCNGVPQYCCYFNGVKSCKAAPWAPIQCPQIADC